MTQPKRYVLVGTGSRGLGMFARPLCTDFPKTARLVGVYDVNPLRASAAVAELPRKVPVYTSFRKMLAEQDPDGIIVASRDSTHARYIVAGLRAGKRVISEKPLCTTLEQCRQILRAASVSKTGSCLVTHNARYGAAASTIRSILRSGRLGRVLFMQYEETLDRCHGADYFRRWHRYMANSGGLLVHKACHHFDLLNWWAEAKPVWVSARGALRFYGANGPFWHARCRDCPHGKTCEFHADMFKWDKYRKLYLEAEVHDGYMRDGCVFDPTIDIFDQMGVLIRYENGIEVNYSLVAYSPLESERVVIEGTDGRLEYTSRSNTGWVVDSHPIPGIEELVGEQLRLYLPRKGMILIPLRRPKGGHGGADPQLRKDFFGRLGEHEPSEQMATLEEAVQAVLIGIAANRSINTGRPVAVQSLIG
ncbi:MAG: Gfo/Idh/MocA family oxidoreductase [Kiritimatiellae bacterium]|nr:Gfo/Idh/MocA family oxidoreductase [Kiritimatiellia bacterium]